MKEELKETSPLDSDTCDETLRQQNMQIIMERIEFVAGRLKAMAGTLPPSYEREILPFLCRMVDEYKTIDNTLISNFVVSILKALLVGPSAMFDLSFLTEVLMSDQKELLIAMADALRQSSEAGRRVGGFALMLPPDEDKECATCPKHDDCPGCSGIGEDMGNSAEEEKENDPNWWKKFDA